MNVQRDRLSNLSDDLIHNILSFISVKQAIETSVLSSRWRFIWTSMHCLNFSSRDLTPTFVSNVLSRRNNQIRVSSVKLGQGSEKVVDRIFEYTSSHHAQQLTVLCDHYVQFPLYFFCSRSLKHLSLSGGNGPYCSSTFLAPPSCYINLLPALTTLHLDHIGLSDWYLSDDQCIGLFSKCVNLKNLSLSACSVSETTVLNICHPRLSNLSSIRCYGKYLISAPGVTSVIKIKDYDSLQLSTHALCSFEKLDLCIYRPVLADSHKILSLLQELQSVKYLTLNLEILELFSHSIRRISGQPSPFANFEIAEFVTNYPARVCMQVRAHKKINTSTEVKNYQLDSSSSSVFPKVSCEEMKVMKDMVCTQRLIAESRVLLEQYATKKGRMVHDNVPMKMGKPQVKKQWTQSAFELQWHFGEMMAMIKQRKSEGLLTNLPTTQICHTISWLQRIERSLTRLHASKRGPMQATFSSLCEEAAFVSNKLLDCIKIHYTKKPKHAGKTATNG